MQREYTTTHRPVMRGHGDPSTRHCQQFRKPLRRSRPSHRRLLLLRRRWSHPDVCRTLQRGQGASGGSYTVSQIGACVRNKLNPSQEPCVPRLGAWSEPHLTQNSIFMIKLFHSSDLHIRDLDALLPQPLPTIRTGQRTQTIFLTQYFALAAQLRDIMKYEGQM